MIIEQRPGWVFSIDPQSGVADPHGNRAIKQFCFLQLFEHRFPSRDLRIKWSDVDSFSLWCLAILFGVVETKLDIDDLSLNLGQRGSFFRRCIDKRPFDQLRTRHDSSESVIVISLDRVKLVVMTAGTGDGQAEKAASHRIESLIPLVCHNHRNHVGGQLRFFVVHRR